MLNNHLIRINNAPGNEAVAVAVETQAERTLGMVKGLQNEVEECNATITKLKAQNEELVSANGNAVGQARQLGNELDETKAKLQAVEAKATEEKAITDQQSQLIQKLMSTNARLSGLGANEKVL